MKIFLLLIAIVLLVSAVVIMYTEKSRESIGLGMIMCGISGYLFRMVTDDDL